MPPARSTWPRWARIVTSPWLVSPVIVLALLVGAFFAYGAYTRSQPTHYSRGGDVFGLVTNQPPTTPSPGARVAGRGQKVKPAGKAGDSAAPRTRLVPTSAAAPRSGQSSAGANTGGGRPGGKRPAMNQRPALPLAGNYALSVSGGEHVKFGPFSACTNTFPSRSTLAVKPASGEPAGSYDFDLRFYPSSPNKHDERHIYRYAGTGVTLSYEEATVTCGGIKQSSTVQFSPPQQRVRYPLATGKTWSSDGGDSARTEKATSQVLGTATVVIDGHPYQTWEIQTHVTMSGSESGTRDQRWWWSPDLAMPVKWSESLSGRRSGATYSENVTVAVVGLP